MKKSSNFVSTITEMGFDINKPFDMTVSGNDNGLTLSFRGKGRTTGDQILDWQQ